MYVLYYRLRLGGGIDRFFTEIDQVSDVQDLSDYNWLERNECRWFVPGTQEEDAP